MSDQKPLVQTRQLTKIFGSVHALAHVDFNLYAGEIHAVLGENGAGKSTLIKLITGVYHKDGGTILLEGEPIEPQSPHDAQAYGISAVYQEINLVPTLSVAENIYLGRQPMRFGLVDMRRVNAQAKALLQTYNLDIDVTRTLSTYSVAIQQIVAIARGVDMSAKVLILDEPTASLDAGARARFAELERELLGAATVILCSHRLDELRTMVDRVVSMADGSVIHDGEARAFVADHTRTVIELRLARAEHAEDAAWLGGRGFTKTGGGWWSAAVGHDDKLRLLPEVMATLGAALDDIVVRDLDRLVVPPTRPELAGGAS